MSNETSWIHPGLLSREAAATSQGGSRWKPRKTSAEKKADNRRKRAQSGSIARNAVTAKFIKKLEAKDTFIGQLQALQSSAVMVGSLRETERDTAQAGVVESE